MTYQLRYVVLVGAGATFVLAHVAEQFSAWAPWLVPMLVAAICGALIAEGNNGAGAGALAAGLGGFLFVFGNLMDSPITEGMALTDAIQVSTIQGINAFALFGLVGMVAGGVAGISAAYAKEKATDTEDASTDN